MPSWTDAFRLLKECRDTGVAREVRAMRSGAMLVSLVLAVCSNAFFVSADRTVPLAAIGLEALVPILFVPAFTAVVGEDRATGMHEVLLAHPAVMRLYLRRLGAVTAYLLAGLTLVAWIWPDLSHPLVVSVVVGLAPTMLLGSLAHLMVVFGIAEPVAISALLGLWFFEQFPVVVRFAASTPFYYLYLTPELRLGTDGRLLANKLLMLALASVALICAQYLVASPARRVV